MAFPIKFTAQRGKPAKGQIAIAAGTAEAQTDTMSLNIDANKISKGEALILIDNIRDVVAASKWPAI